MRKLPIALLAALALIIGTSTTAQAAADITRGGSCSVSANWSITTSVNFNNTSGSPSTGSVDYVVLNSPGALYTGGAAGVEFFNASGGSISTGPDIFIRDYDKPGYVYRADYDSGPGVRRVKINPKAYTGTYCSEYSSPSTIYSAN